MNYRIFPTKYGKANYKKKKPEYNLWGYNGELEMFMDIWNSRPHRSELSNRPIHLQPGQDLWFNCFAHILSKSMSKYYKFKLNPENIMLMLPEEHHLYDMGTIEQREQYARMYKCSWEVVRNKAEVLKEEYKKI